MKKFLVFLILNFLFIIPAFGANLSGWAWSGNVGWISFHGTSADDVTGGLYGYAWSENIGWIRLNPKGPYPDSPDFSARLMGGKIRGWARACAGAANPDCSGEVNPDAGGWDGWINFSGDGYSVEQIGDIVSGCSLSGYAWGSDVLGWIRFGGSFSDDQVFIENCVEVGEEEPPIASEPIDCIFTAYPTRLIPPKKSTRLTWSCINSESYSCGIYPSIGPVTPASGGSVLVVTPATTNYNLHCENDRGNSLDLFATVTVIKSRICETIPFFPTCN